MKQVKTQTRTRETDFKSVLRAFFSVDEDDEFNMDDNKSEIEIIEKMPDISEEDRKILIASLVSRDKLANKLFSIKSKTRRKKSSIKVAASKNGKEEKHTARISSKINIDAKDKERE